MGNQWLARNFLSSPATRLQGSICGGQEPVATDAQGHFIFAHVPPGTVRIELKQPMAAGSWTYQELATTNVRGRPERTMVQINFEGRPVTGQLKRNADLTNGCGFDAVPDFSQPDVTPPKCLTEMDAPEKVQKWYQDWMKTDAGRKYTRSHAQTKPASSEGRRHVQRRHGRAGKIQIQRQPLAKRSDAGAN